MQDIHLTLTPEESIQETIDRIEYGQHARVELAAGDYTEKVIVDKPYVSICGASPSSTKIIYSDFANKLHEGDAREYGTFRTFTLCVTAPHVTLENVSIINTAGNPAQNGQSVALSAYGHNLTVSNCVLSSTHATLFCGPLPDDLVAAYDSQLPDILRYYEGESLQVYHKTKIIGSIDSIFGCANAWFDACAIVSTHDDRDIGYVSAPAHSLKQKYGFQFLDCHFSHHGCKTRSIYLARPWRDFGKATFINATISDHVHPALFDSWENSGREKTARFSYFSVTGAEICPPAWGTALREEEETRIRRRYEQVLQALRKSRTM